MDGFSTISRNFCLGAEAWMGTYFSNNYALNTYFDQEGTSHWFLQTSVPSFGIDIYGNKARFEGSRDIVYRRTEAEPDFANEDMALNLYDFATPHNRVVVPTTQSLQQKEAVTIELSVKPVTPWGIMLANRTDSPYHDGSLYNGGWFLDQVRDWDG